MYFITLLLFILVPSLLLVSYPNFLLRPSPTTADFPTNFTNTKANTTIIFCFGTWGSSGGFCLDHLVHPPSRKMRKFWWISQTKQILHPPIGNMRKFGWISQTSKQNLHHLVHPIIGNMMFFSVLGVRTPEMLLQTIYTIVWIGMESTHSGIRKTFRGENPFHHNFWKQLKNQCLQSSFFQPTMLLQLGV